MATFDAPMVRLWNSAAPALCQPALPCRGTRLQQKSADVARVGRVCVRDDDDIDKRPVNPELARMLEGAVKAKARFVALAMALAVGTFAWLARDAGQPMWLVLVIGALGSVLIVFFVALVWFWLRFLSHFRGKD